MIEIASETVLTSSDFILIANAIAIGIHDDDPACFAACFAWPIRKGATAVFFGRIQGIVASQVLGASEDFICVANPITIVIISKNHTGSIRFARTRFTGRVRINTRSRVGCILVEIARSGIQTASNLIAIADTVVVIIVFDDDTGPVG